MGDYTISSNCNGNINNVTNQISDMIDVKDKFAIETENEIDFVVEADVIINKLHKHIKTEGTNNQFDDTDELSDNKAIVHNIRENDFIVKNHVISSDREECTDILTDQMEDVNKDMSVAGNKRKNYFLIETNMVFNEHYKHIKIENKTEQVKNINNFNDNPASENVREIDFIVKDYRTFIDGVEYNDIIRKKTDDIHDISDKSVAENADKIEFVVNSNITLEEHYKYIRIEDATEQADNIDEMKSKFALQNIRKIDLVMKDYLHPYDYNEHNKTSTNQTNEANSVGNKSAVENVYENDFITKDNMTLQYHDKNLSIVDEINETDIEDNNDKTFVETTSGTDSVMKANITRSYRNKKLNQISGINIVSDKTADENLKKTDFLVNDKMISSNHNKNSNILRSTKIIISEIYKSSYSSYKTTSTTTGYLQKPKVAGNCYAKACNSQAFNQRASKPLSFQTHINAAHEVRKPYKCPNCIYRASQAVLLQRHIIATHGRIKTLKCEKCRYSTYEFDNLRKHNDAVHDKVEASCMSRM